MAGRLPLGEIQREAQLAEKLAQPNLAVAILHVRSLHVLVPLALVGGRGGRASHHDHSAPPRRPPRRHSRAAPGSSRLVLTSGRDEPKAAVGDVLAPIVLLSFAGTGLYAMALVAR